MKATVEPSFPNLPRDSNEFQVVLAPVLQRKSRKNNSTPSFLERARKKTSVPCAVDAALEDARNNVLAKTAESLLVGFSCTLTMAGFCINPGTASQIQPVTRNGHHLAEENKNVKTPTRLYTVHRSAPFATSKVELFL